MRFLFNLEHNKSSRQFELTLSFWSKRQAKRLLVYLLKFWFPNQWNINANDLVIGWH